MSVSRDWCEEHTRGSLAETDGLCPDCEERSARRRGLFAQLTPEQQKAALGYDGPVGFGRSDLPRATSLKAVEVDRILARIAGPHNAMIYVGKDYTIAQLEADLRELRVIKR